MCLDRCSIVPFLWIVMHSFLRLSGRKVSRPLYKVHILRINLIKCWNNLDMWKIMRSGVYKNNNYNFSYLNIVASIITSDFSCFRTNNVLFSWIMSVHYHGTIVSKYRQHNESRIAPKFGRGVEFLGTEIMHNASTVIF